jgi:hypothetical protein
MTKKEMLSRISVALMEYDTNVQQGQQGQVMTHDDSARVALDTVIKWGMRTPLRYEKIHDELLGIIDVAVGGWSDE